MYVCGVSTPISGEEVVRCRKWACVNGQYEGLSSVFVFPFRYYLSIFLVLSLSLNLNIGASFLLPRWRLYLQASLECDR